MAASAPTQYMSVSEAAIHLQVSAATVRRWVTAGVLTATQPAGPNGLIRIPTAELDRLEHGA
jgi:excisionase family DNA binding protein